MASDNAISTACRFCGAALTRVLVDLGMSPLCESFLTSQQIDCAEVLYPLRPYLCHHCFLVQLPEYVAPDDIFTEYAYFSSYSKSWLRHAEDYTVAMVERFQLDRDSQVAEIASNDGYLLQYFVQRGIAVLGIEPAANVARAAVERGVPTTVRFFSQCSASDIAARSGHFDLVIANNVLAQAPRLNDFVAGIKTLLKPGGAATLEFPHLLQLLHGNEFDTIYHEHYSYFSFYTVVRILRAHGLRVFDVEELSTHGGSLRVFACHENDSSKPTSHNVSALHEKEARAAIDQLSSYEFFAARVAQTKRQILQTLIEIKENRKSIVAYGAPGKGNTLLNYCGIGTDFLDYAVDRNPYKHGRFTPGTHIPIYPPERIAETKPDYVLILPWNLKGEIVPQLEYIREWGGRIIVPIPQVEVC